MEKVFPSLRYIAENGLDKDNEAAKAVGSIFGRTEDILARDLCLSALRKIGNKVAKRERLRIYNDTRCADAVAQNVRRVFRNALAAKFAGWLRISHENLTITREVVT